MAAYVAVAALVALLGGCGDDDAPITTISTEGEPTDTSVTADEYIVSADARCAEANAALANLGTESSSIVVGQRLGITQEVLSGLQGLGAPEDPDGDLAEYLGALRTQVSVLEEQQTAAASGDTAAVDALSLELDAAESDALTAGEAFGFEDCGQPPSASAGGTTTTSPGGTVPVDPAVVPPGTAVPETPVEPVPEPVPTTPPAGGTDTGGDEVPAPEPEPEPSGGGSGGFSP